MNLSNNIYHYRTAKNWSQSELADMLNVSRQSVSKWENNSVTPDLDKLIKMKELFNITLDDLVFSTPNAPAQTQADDIKSPNSPFSLFKARIVAGMIMLIFGLVFFLLSIFFGNHLYFGEAFGEFMSLLIVLLSIATIFTYDMRAIGICTTTLFLYCVIYFGFMKTPNILNYLFISLANVIILVWFITCGEHANKKELKIKNTQTWSNYEDNN